MTHVKCQSVTSSRRAASGWLYQAFDICAKLARKWRRKGKGKDTREASPTDMKKIWGRLCREEKLEEFRRGYDSNNKCYNVTCVINYPCLRQKLYWLVQDYVSTVSSRSERRGFQRRVVVWIFTKNNKRRDGVSFYFDVKRLMLFRWGRMSCDKPHFIRNSDWG